MSTDCKVRIYKTNVRPLLTYAAETRAETTYTPATAPNYRDEDNKGGTWEDD